MEFALRQETRGRFFLELGRFKEMASGADGRKSFPATCVIDRDGIITSWNEAAEDLFGYSASEAIGRCLYNLCDGAETYDGSLERALSVAYHQGNAEQDGRYIGKSGVRFAGRMSIVPRWERREFCGYTISIGPSSNVRRETNGADCEPLSERETEVLNLIGEGLTTRQIADRLSLALSTVETYRERLKTKLKLASGTALIRYAVIQAIRHDGSAK